ncbi:MAG: hypothetical protein DMF61_14180 [Blastocatellia bacterium AA13]|nr:MAG: hypothetical protein DMF61_14180 [Blastocatellia bacterium AA13]
MSTQSTSTHFEGVFKDALSALASTLDDLMADHGTSFVKAGDDRVYALGGDGYVVVLDERKWDGLVEVLTPDATISVRPTAEGKHDASSPNLEARAVAEKLREANSRIRAYYNKRYWKTPKTV